MAGKPFFHLLLTPPLFSHLLPPTLKEKADTPPARARRTQKKESSLLIAHPLTTAAQSCSLPTSLPQALLLPSPYCNPRTNTPAHLSHHGAEQTSTSACSPSPPGLPQPSFSPHYEIVSFSYKSLVASPSSLLLCFSAAIAILSACPAQLLTLHTFCTTAPLNPPCPLAQTETPLTAARTVGL